MKKTRKPTVAVLFGGRGAEHDISLVSGQFVMEHIDKERFSVLPVLLSREGDWLLFKRKSKVKVDPVLKNGHFSLSSRRRSYHVDAVFPVLHGDFGEDGKLQGLLELLGAKLIGCGTHASALGSDKRYSKAVAYADGIPTLPWVSVTRDAKELAIAESEAKLGYPVFVKPARLGSSVGVGIAHDRSELVSRLSLALMVGDGQAMIERCLESPTELECAFFSAGREKSVTHPGKVVANGGFYSYEEKYLSGTATVSVKADVDAEIAKAVTDHARRICELFEIDGIARVDFFLSKEGEIYFNEINTVPGMTKASLYPLMLEAHGIAPRTFINALIEDAVYDRRV